MPRQNVFFETCFCSLSFLSIFHPYHIRCHARHQHTQTRSTHIVATHALHQFNHLAEEAFRSFSLASVKYKMYACGIWGCVMHECMSEKLGRETLDEVYISPRMGTDGHTDPDPDYRMLTDPVLLGFEFWNRYSGLWNRGSGS